MGILPEPCRVLRRCANGSSSITQARSASTRGSFPASDELLAGDRGARLRWGIVTNKSTGLTRLLVEGARDLDARAACVVWRRHRAAPQALTPASRCCTLAKELAPHRGVASTWAIDLRRRAGRCAPAGHARRSRSSGATARGYSALWQADAVIARPADLLSAALSPHGG